MATPSDEDVSSAGMRRPDPSRSPGKRSHRPRRDAGAPSPCCHAQDQRSPAALPRRGPEPAPGRHRDRLAPLHRPPLRRAGGSRSASAGRCRPRWTTAPSRSACTAGRPRHRQTAPGPGLGRRPPRAAAQERHPRAAVDRVPGGLPRRLRVHLVHQALPSLRRARSTSSCVRTTAPARSCSSTSRARRSRSPTPHRRDHGGPARSWRSSVRPTTRTPRRCPARPSSTGRRPTSGPSSSWAEPRRSWSPTI